jgi:uncharacterized membrane protein YhaH (DUF805 family)
MKEWVRPFGLFGGRVGRKGWWVVVALCVVAGIAVPPLFAARTFAMITLPYGIRFF